MPSNVGQQTVSIIFHAPAHSSIVNRRHKDTRMPGIYKGGYLSKVDGSHASLSPLVCEIGDSTHQVRIQTELAVNIAVNFNTPYIVLRWTYTGDVVDDYMAILPVATPQSNDVIVGKCIFVGVVLQDLFLYDERTSPDIQHLFLRVEPTEDVELRVRIRGGRIQTNSGVIDISDQKSDLFIPPASNSKVYLVYVDTNGSIQIDSSGASAVNPAPPSYKGKLVLAEVTLASTDTNITADKIKDVRNWITESVTPDGIKIAKDSNGKLTTTRCFRDYILIRDVKASGVNGGTFTSGAWRTRDLIQKTSDDGGHAGLGANRITLAAGTYECSILCPAVYNNNHQARLYNVSDSVVVAYGTNAETDAVSQHTTSYSIIKCRFTIVTSKVFEIQHRCSQTCATLGFGSANSFGGEEVYTIAEFWKVA